MNSLWFKIASGAIGILIIIVLVSMFMPSGGNKESAPPAESNNPPVKTFAEQTEKDRAKYLVTQKETAFRTDANNTSKPVEPNGITAQSAPAAPKPKEIMIYVKRLNQEDQIQADQEISNMVTMLDIGRLPVTSMKPAIDSARRILSRWPDSMYAYKAKQMLAAIPERYQQQYNITAQEKDSSMFLKPRAGTEPYPMPIEER